MTVLASIASQLVHAMLVAAAAFFGACAMPWLVSHMRGQSPRPILQPWRDLARSMRKQPIELENASGVFRAAPICALAGTATAALLIPGFALGMATAPIADVVCVVGLLALGRVALLLAAMDSGSARGGIAAARGAQALVVATPALLLVALTLAMLAGGTQFDPIVALQREGLLFPAGAGVFAAAALLAVATVECAAWSDGWELEFGGRDLVLIRVEAAVRLVCWIDLILCLFLPFGIALPGTGLAEHGFGLLCWAIEYVALVAVFAATTVISGPIRRTASAEILGAAGLLALIAAAIVLATTAVA